MPAFPTSTRYLVGRAWQRPLWNPSSVHSRVTCRHFTASRIRPSPSSSAKGPKRATLKHNTQAIALVAGAAALVFAVNLYHATPARCDALQRPAATDDGRDPNLPRFRLAEVRKHDGSSPNPWVIHGDKVYDITDWIPAHPGGEVILRAAGGPIEAYWDIFAIHKNDYVLDILKQFQIGLVDAVDLVNGRPAREAIEDPFAEDPLRHPDLITMTAKPRNAETPADATTADFLTPNDLFYVRNHMWVPTIDEDPGRYTLTVELEDGSVKTYTLDDLRTRFPARRVTAVLQCSGNRRSHMSEGSGRKANGLPWDVGAISNACWEGVYLSDVLADAGFDLASGITGTSEAKHVHFMGLEAYGASIPIKKAVDPQGDVLLAYGMNGQPLPRDHGFPLRAVVPGHVAARSVKWLNHITLSDEESQSQWQRKDYKCFGPNQTHVDWETAPAIQEMPVQSAITGCKLGEWTTTATTTTKESLAKSDGRNKGAAGTNNPNAKPQARGLAQRASLTGYAYSGGGRAIVRVDVSLDGGKTWSQAQILPDCVSKDGSPSPCLGHGSWAWRRWKYEGLVPLEAFDCASKVPGTSGAGRHDERKNSSDRTLTNSSDAPVSSGRRCATFVVKATDESYNTQPESHAATWNVRGNLATAWHRLQMCSKCPEVVEDDNPSDPYERWENI